MPPSRPLEVDLVTPSVELKSKKCRNISFAEKESIQAELAGYEDIYQQVCCVSDKPVITPQHTSTSAVLEVIIIIFLTKQDMSL